jgi:menaquinone-dependent protoporphyrinogen oxidase
MHRTMLVAYASRHGSTAAIAQRIAATLHANDVDAVARPIGDLEDFEGYDGYVVGSAVYSARWLADARTFVHEHHAELRRHPVWLFSSGPLSSDPQARKQAVPRDAGKLATELNARRHQVFAGVWRQDAEPVGVLEAIVSHVPGAAKALPEGDFRDWPAIDEFAQSIAAELEVAVRSE